MSNRQMRSALVACLIISGCGQSDQSISPATRESPATRAERIDAQRLPNAFRLNDKVISGGMPEGEEAFRELQSLGVKTIIDVDGAQPDVALAHQFGMRYIHLPHGYDGIPERRVKELAKAVRDLDGPIYIHCHHGKHRAPTAAVVACVGAGLTKPSDAIPYLHLAGTSENYRGLYQSAEHAKRIDDAVLDKLRVEFPEIAPLPPLAATMVAIDQTHDRLAAVSKAGWRIDPKHPDVEPAHEALILREHFTELLRTPEVKKKPQRFRDLAIDTETAAQKLEAELRKWNPASAKSPPPASIGKLFGHISSNCVHCHKEYRDVPLSEKKG